MDRGAEPHLLPVPSGLKEWDGGLGKTNAFAHEMLDSFAASVTRVASTGGDGFLGAVARPNKAMHLQGVSRVSSEV